MKTKIAMGGILLLLLIVAGMVSFSWSSKPWMVANYPQAGATNIPATTAIELVFSRRMDTVSVSERLNIEPAMDGKYTWDRNTLTFTPTQAWPAGQEIKLNLAAGARAASWISFPMGEVSWSFKTNDKMIAYLWPSDGSADIFALTPNSGEIFRYTRGMGVLDFSVSRNGIMIYFSAGNSQSGANIYRIDRTQVGGTAESDYQAQKLLDCGAAQCRNPEVSADDQYLAYEYIPTNASGSTDAAQIWLMDLTSMQTTQVSLVAHETIQPTWSSKGTLLYYDRTSSGYEVINLLTQERKILANQTGQPGEWSPDGNYFLAPEITYYQAPGDTERGTSHLMRYGLANATAEDLSKSLDVEDANATYSPVGNFIAFSRKFLDAAHWSLGRQIWIMNSDGSGAHPITDEPDYNHYDLAWSMDGLMIAYVRFNESKLSTPPELWMVNSDGSNAVQLVIGGYSPIWIP
jgi:Tol biopolymer transport system component